LKVNFLIIGAAKSATTSLSNALSKHPDICFSQPKEPQFFSKENWRDNISDYHSKFKDNTKLCGEGSTNYTKYPYFNINIHDDIYEYNPEMKLIYIMRHPIDRITSHYIHSYNRGYEVSKDIDDAIKTNQQYLDTSCYAMQIEPYIQRFGQKNILLLFFEDFISNPQSVIHCAFKFLNVDSIPIEKKDLDSNKSFNRRVLHYKYDHPKTLWEKFKKVGLIIKNYFNTDFLDSKPHLSEATKKQIIDHVKDDISKIEKLTNRNLSHWLDY
jgi:hypothetical protein